MNSGEFRISSYSKVEEERSQIRPLKALGKSGWGQLKNKMSKKKINKIILAGLTVGLLGIGGVASAHGMWGMSNLNPQEFSQGQTSMFQSQAEILGISVDKVKEAWANGKSFSDLATENGVTKDQLQAKMKTLRETQIQSQLKILVDNGVITQAQADQRLNFMKTNTDKGRMGMMGFGRGWNK